MFKAIFLSLSFCTNSAYFSDELSFLFPMSYSLFFFVYLSLSLSLSLSSHYFYATLLTEATNATCKNDLALASCVLDKRHKLMSLTSLSLSLSLFRTNLCSTHLLSIFSRSVLNADFYFYSTNNHPSLSLFNLKEKEKRKSVFFHWKKNVKCNLQD